MNVVLNIKERQLQRVLGELEKIGNGVDIVVNIEEDGFKEEEGSLTGGDLEPIQEEMREQVFASADARIIESLSLAFSSILINYLN